MDYQVHSVSPKGGATNFSLGRGADSMSKRHWCWWGWRKAIEEGKLFPSQKVATWVSMQKLATYLVSEPQETPKTAKLATIGMYGASQGQ